VVPPAERAVFWGNRAAAHLALHTAHAAAHPRPQRPPLFPTSATAGASGGGSGSGGGDGSDGGGGGSSGGGSSSATDPIAATAAVDAWEASARAADSDCTAALEEDPAYAKAYARRAAARRVLERYAGAAADLRALAALRREGGAAPAGGAAAASQSPAELDREAARLDAAAAAQAERQKGEALAALKDMGSAFLKPFGIDVSGFKAEKDPATGSYNLKFGG